MMITKHEAKIWIEYEWSAGAQKRMKKMGSSSSSEKKEKKENFFILSEYKNLYFISLVLLMAGR